MCGINTGASLAVCVQCTHITIALGAASYAKGHLYAVILECSSPHILRPPFQPEECGLKVKVISKWKDIYSRVTDGRS